MDLKIGDLVQCRDNHYNQGLRLVGKIGMVAELRKKDLRILFDANNQEIWLSKQGVNRIVSCRPPTLQPCWIGFHGSFIRWMQANASWRSPSQGIISWSWSAESSHWRRSMRFVITWADSWCGSRSYLAE